MCLQCLHGLIISRHAPNKAAYKKIKGHALINSVTVNKVCPCHFHGILRNGACFINAENINSGQRLNALHIIYKNLLLGQADNAYHQGHTGKEVESLGNHTQDGSHRSNHAGFNSITQYEILMAYKNGSHGNDYDTHNLNQSVKVSDHLRLLSLTGLLGSQGKLGNVGLTSDLRQLSVTTSGYYVASGKKRISRLLGDLIRFTGNKGFINGNLAGYHHGIGTDLVAG